MSMYAQAGVNINENDIANELIKRLVPVTFDENVVVGMEGLFSAGYRIDKNNGRFVGQGLVCVNHESELERNIQQALKALKAEHSTPLFLTDYLAFGKLKATEAARFVLRVIEGGRREDGSFIPLIAGEVAEMPDVIERGAEIVVAITYQTEKDKEGRIDLSATKGDILTTSIDSVGTKTKLGLQTGRLEGLFKDMIGHSVGDINVQSATPLGVAMYVGQCSTFKHDLHSHYAETIAASNLADMVFATHGRTIYCKGQFDIVGSILGIVDEKNLLTGKNIQAGDHLIGWKSFGVNTNGYSLIRKLGDAGKIDYEETLPGTDMTVGEALMQSHQDYRPAMQDARTRFGQHLKGAAHITGGGIAGNTSRLLPAGLKVNVESLPANPVFAYLQQCGNIPEKDMNQTYNRGVGVMFVVDKEYDTSGLPEQYHVIGNVKE